MSQSDLGNCRSSNDVKASLNRSDRWQCWRFVMSSVIFKVAIVGVAFGMFSAGSEAEAAKGVKKTTANGSHTVTGIVTSIIPASNSSGTFQLRAANLHKKTGVLNSTSANGSSQGIELHVTPATQFQHSNGTVIKTNALHVGNHVRVQTAGSNAQSVHLLSTHHATGNFQRHRANTYRPHIVRHRRR